MVDRRLMGILLSVPVVAGCSSDRAAVEDAQQRTVALERENAELRSTIETLEGRLQEFKDAVAQTHFGPHRLDAVVLQVDDAWSCVVLDKGSTDGVEVGSLFDVYRGSEFKGQVRIEEVRAGSARGVVDLEVVAISPGDSGFCPSQVIVCPAYPGVDAVVLEIDRDWSSVVFDKGSDDGVKVDLRFDVYRGATYKGNVRIESVRNTRSRGVILNEINEITPGDSATTSL